MDKKMTRQEFLKMVGFTMFAILILPGLKRLNLTKGAHKEARYYKNLTG